MPIETSVKTKLMVAHATPLGKFPDGTHDTLTSPSLVLISTSV